MHCLPARSSDRNQIICELLALDATPIFQCCFKTSYYLRRKPMIPLHGRMQRQTITFRPLARGSRPKADHALGLPHFWRFSPQNRLTTSRQIDHHYIVDNSAFRWLFTVQWNLPIHKFFSLFFCAPHEAHEPPCCSWQLDGYIPWNEAAVEIVLKEYFSPLTRLNSAVVSLKSLLTIKNNIIEDSFLAPRFVICLGRPQNCRLSSHSVRRNFFKNLETALSHFTTNRTTPFTRCSSRIKIKISPFCTLLMSNSTLRRSSKTVSV